MLTAFYVFFPWVGPLGLRNGVVVGPIRSYVDAIGDMCGVQKCSLRIFEHTGRSDAHGYLGVGVLPTV